MHITRVECPLSEGAFVVVFALTILGLGLEYRHSIDQFLRSVLASLPNVVLYDW